MPEESSILPMRLFRVNALTSFERKLLAPAASSGARFGNGKMGTIFSATDFLFEQGARGVSAAVVHPVLSGRALERLGASRLERLLVTDTIPIAATSAKIEVLSVAPLLAEAITRIHDGRSVSALF